MKKHTKLLCSLLCLCLLLSAGCQDQAAPDGSPASTPAPAAFGPRFQHSELALDAPLFQPGTADSNGLLGMSFGGTMGARMENQMDNWMYTAYYSNPGMLEVFRQRESPLALPVQAWYGEFPGKYLTSAALMYQLNHDAALKAAADDLVAQLAQVQAEDGYLGVFSQSDRILGSVDTNINGQANHGANWDLWNHYHIIRGLLAWYRQTGNETALTTARQAADYIAAFFQSGHTLSEVQEGDKNLSFLSAWVDLYELTGDERYLDFLNDALAAWQLTGNCDFYHQGLAGTPFFSLAFNRWEAMHSVLALSRIYELTGDDTYQTAFLNLWESLRDYDRHNSGGVTNAERAVGTPYQSGSVETCATVAWLELSAQALRLTGDSTIADELELSTLNAILGAQSPSGRWYTYNTPDEGVRLASSHELTFQAVPGSPELNCCALSGPSGLGLISRWALFADEGGVTLNYYGEGETAARTPAGKPLLLRQETAYPADGAIRLTLSLEGEEQFPLRLRIPAWSENTRLQVNGEAVSAQAGSYCTLERSWKDGDVIELELDMTLRLWAGEEIRMDCACIYYGPVLLALDERFNPTLSVQDLGAVPLDGLTLTPAEHTVIPAYPAPLVLFQARLSDGQSLVLCDFATAGMAGTNYTTWLPAADRDQLPSGGWCAKEG